MIKLKLSDEFTKLHEDLSSLKKIKDKRKYIENIVKKNELFHSPMINKLPEMVYYCRNDANRTMEFVSKGCFYLTGYKPEDLILNNKISYEKIIHQEDRNMVRGDVEKAVGHSKQFHLEYRIITAENKIKWVSEVGQLLLLPFKNLQMLEGFIIDITDRKQAEESLKENEEFNKSILENSPSPILIINPDKSIRYVNPALEKITGFSFKEIISLGKKTPYPWWIKGMESIYTEKLKYSMTKGIDTTELPFINKNGQKFWVEITSKPVKSNQKLEYVLINFINITEQKKAYDELEKTLNNTITTMASIAEKRDPFTAGHQRRVAALAVKIAQELNLSDNKIKAIKTAAFIHDIGKINIPLSILSKPGKLTDIEFEVVKTHPRAGYDIVKKIEFHYPIANFILQHHERVGGFGYPNGLKSKDITLEAKIIGVADVVEAMSSPRPYRPALGIEKVLEEIQNNKGKLYDPEIVEACLKIITDKKFSFE
ncbi:MAG: HD domain-containing phosphohydrolase [Candidatus Hydromicrobium sp.]